MAKKLIMSIFCLFLAVITCSCTISLGPSSAGESKTASENSVNILTSGSGTLSANHSTVNSVSHGQSNNIHTSGEYSSNTSNGNGTGDQNDAESKEVVLLIDRSAGMCGGEGDNGFTVQYGKNRLQVVQDAVMECLSEGVFSPNDYIGVIFFGGKTYTPIEALHLTSASNIIGIKNAVGMDITSIAGGKNYLGSTEWRHALETATKMLQSSNAGDNDHIIMITDGSGTKTEGESAQLNGYPVGCWKIDAPKYTDQPIPSGVPQSCYTDYIFRNYSITTSVINVGCNLSPAKEYLQMMETASDVDGKEHYYYTETQNEIISAIKSELVGNSNGGQGSTIPLPSGISKEAKFLILAIEQIGTITTENFVEKKGSIIECENEYNKLSEQQKAEVFNLSKLVEARASYNTFYEKDMCSNFEALVKSLPEAYALTNADVPNVNKAVKIFFENQAILEKGLSNYSALKDKVLACHNKVLSSTVEMTYIAQDGNGNGILEDSVVDINGINRSEITNPRKRGSNYTVVSNPFGITDRIHGFAGSSDHTYTDYKNKTPVKIFQYTDFSSFTFTATNPGKLTLYVRVGSNRTYTVTQNGETIFIKTAGNDPASCMFEIDVQKGPVTVTTIGAMGYLCAVKFSYPDIKPL